MRQITLDDLASLQEVNPGVKLIDVRLEEDFKAGHVRGALNVTVFKMTFTSDLEACGCSKSDTIAVYGANPDSHEARVAAEKLDRAGYRDVLEFRGGIKEWIDSGRPTEGEGQRPAAGLLNGTFPVNLEESRVEWLGRNLLNKHFGTVALKAGEVTCRDGILKGGDFMIDMNTIACTDIADTKLSQVLVEHLKSDDFFDVERYPEARFRIGGVEAVDGATPGRPNLRITGEFTLRGQTNNLVLFGITGTNAEGHFVAQAVLEFDRTLWGSIYGSGAFFKNVGMHLVNDLVEIQVRLVA
jgi:rhodanese-related sulfurtransferase